MADSGPISVIEHIEERERLKRSDRLIRGACAMIMVLCVVVAGGVVLPELHTKRTQLELVVSQDTYQDLPPGIALPGAMLATFRGMIIHFLWTRAEELKQNGKYHELQHLYDWICQMQPRFPKVWENSAWNMAYNVSVGTYTPQARWHWVYSGIKLLRDQAIPQNPKAILLYSELARIYWHKVGDFMDDYHLDYKRYWAIIVERILGQPPREPIADELMDEMKSIADAASGIRVHGPLSNSEALLKYIQSDTSEPSMAEIHNRITQLGFEANGTLLEYFARVDRQGLQVLDLLAVEQNADSNDQQNALVELKNILSREELSPALNRYLAAVRAHVLYRELKLDAVYMYELMERYGPLDWRNAYSSTLYWSSLGLRECEGTIGLNENAEMQIVRMMQFALKGTVERGRVILEPDFENPEKSFISLEPDYARLVDKVHELYLKQAEELRDDEDPDEYYKEGPAGRIFKSGHVNFLHSAIQMLYLEGRVSKAQKYYDYLRENYKEFDGSTKSQYLQPLEDFAFQEIKDQLDGFRASPIILNRLIVSACMNMAYGRPTEAAQRLAFAKRGYDYYMQDKLQDPTERRKLPPWPEVLAATYLQFFTTYPLPEQHDLIMKARIWRLIDNESKLRIYRNVEKTLRTIFEENEPPLDFDKAFAPPEGLREYEAQLGEEVKPKPQASDEELPDIEDVETSGGTKR